MKKILFCLIFSSFTLFGQKTDGFCSDYGYFGESVNEINIRFYGDYQKKIIRYDNFSQVKNEIPIARICTKFYRQQIARICNRAHKQAQTKQIKKLHQ